MNEDKIIEEYLNAQLLCVGNLRDGSQIIKSIFEKLYPQNPHFRTSDIIQFLNDNPSLKNLNQGVTQRRLSSWDKFNN